MDQPLHGIKFENRRILKLQLSMGGETFDRLKAGDGVTVQAGPFRGYGAIFDARLPGDARVRVLLKF